MADKRSRALQITDLPETALFRVFELAGKEHGCASCPVLIASVLVATAPS